MHSKSCFAQNAGRELEAAKKTWDFTGQVNFGLQRLREIHLHPELYVGAGLSGSRDRSICIYLPPLPSLFSLSPASILLTLPLPNRCKEVGIRKVASGGRKQLVGQFPGESFMTCLIAYALAVVLAYLFLPFFNQLADKKLSLSYLADVNLLVGECASCFRAELRDEYRSDMGQDKSQRHSTHTWLAQRIVSPACCVAPVRISVCGCNDSNAI